MNYIIFITLPIVKTLRIINITRPCPLFYGLMFIFCSFKFQPLILTNGNCLY